MADAEPEEAMHLGDFKIDRTLALASGGRVRLIIEGQLMTMNDLDRRFTTAMIQNMEKYASDVGEDAIFDNGHPG